MKLYTDRLDLPDLERIASDMGITLYGAEDRGVKARGKNKGKRELSFLLRPLTDDWRMFRLRDDGEGMKRVWAVSWPGHYEFMRRLFGVNMVGPSLLRTDPNARLVSAIAEYDGREEFLRKAPATGAKNIGSMVNPLLYREAVAE